MTKTKPPVVPPGYQQTTAGINNWWQRNARLRDRGFEDFSHTASEWDPGTPTNSEGAEDENELTTLKM